MDEYFVLPLNSHTYHTRALTHAHTRSCKKQQSPKATWDNHFAAFGAQDLAKIMEDYTEESVVSVYNHTTGAHDAYAGLARVRKFFTELFATLSDLSALAAPLVEVTEAPAPKSVFLAWSCPSSGLVSVSDTFLLDDAFKIARQNINVTTAAGAAAPAAAASEAV